MESFIQDIVNGGMSAYQAEIFLKEYKAQKKQKATAVFLALCFGWIGFHLFYLDRPWIGLLTVLLACSVIWIFVYYFFWLWVTLATMPALLERKNRKFAYDLAAKIRTIYQ